MSVNPDDPQFRLGDMLSEGTSPDMVGPFKPPDSGGIGGAVQSTNNYMVGLQQRDAEQKLQSQTEMKTEVTPEYPGGWTTIGLPSQLAQKYMQSVKAYDQIQSNYQRMIAENQARQAQGKPWANALATIAGSLAANDPNPITRGLGQAAQQLNPTRAQLQAQQMQLLQGQAQAAGQGLQASEAMARFGNQNTRMAMDMAESQRKALVDQTKAEQARRNEQATLFYKLSQDAKDLRLDPAAASVLMKAQGVSDDKSKAMVSYLADAQQKAADLKDKAETAKTAAEAKKFEQQATIQAQKDAAAMDRIMTGADARATAKTATAQAAEEQKTLARNTTTMRPYLKDLQNTQETRAALDKVEKEIKDHPEWFGPFAGRFGEINPYRSGKRELAYQRVRQALPRTIKAEGAGTRGFAKTERDLFVQLSESAKKTPDQNMATIQAWRDTLDEKENHIRNLAEGIGYDLSGLEKSGAIRPGQTAPSHAPAVQPARRKGDVIDLGNGIKAERLD